MASSVDMKLLKQTKFPAEFNQKVDMKKVNLEVMKKWIAGKISEILSNEDDVVIELCYNLLEGSQFPDIKKLQIQLTGFLDKDTAKFCKELWTLCLSAQTSPQGVPKELLEAKKLELIQEKIEAERVAQEARRRKEQEAAREKELESIRQRERGDKRGRGDGRRGGRGREFDRRRGRDSRSPPPRRRGSPDRSGFRGPPPRREMDTYIPAGSRALHSDDRSQRYDRRRSASRPISQSRSRSRSPRRRRDDHHVRRHRQSLSRSPVPYRGRQFTHRSEADDGYGRRKSRDRGDDGQRSITASETSRSPSPRRFRRRHSSTRSAPRSRSPPPRSRRYHHRDIARSRSRSRSRSVDWRHRRASGAGRTRTPSFYEDDAYHARANVRKDRYRDARVRSPSRDVYRPRRHSPARYRSRTRSRTRSRSASPYGTRKRRRSIERYEPVGKRRRHTSSTSPVIEKERNMADSSDKKGARRVSGSQPDETLDKHGSGRPRGSERGEGRPEPKTETELREALLREKVKSLRRASSGATTSKGPTAE